MRFCNAAIPIRIEAKHLFGTVEVGSVVFPMQLGAY